MKKLLLFCLLLCHFSLQTEKDYEGISSSSSKTEVYHDSHNYSVTYEHESHYDSGSFYSSVTFEHTIIDNHDRVEVSNFSMSYIPDEKDYHNSVEIADNHHKIKESHHQNTYENNNSYNQSDYELSPNNRALDNHFEKMVDEIESRNINNSTNIFDETDRNTSHEITLTKRAIIYRWFQKKKESWFGLSKANQEIQDQERKQAIENDNQRKRQAAADLNKKRDALKQPINQTELEQAYQEHQNNVANSTNKTFTTTLEKRNLPFDKSLQNQIRATHSFALRPATIGFLQAHNIDHRPLMELHGLAIQHQLTHELIENLNAFADLATAQRHNQNLIPIIKAGASVSSMAQDFNQSNRLLDAISGTNCSHGFLHYLHGMTLQAFDRCEKMATVLAFFNCEITNYTLAAARGIAKGIVSSEIATLLMSGIGSIASTLAPELTASVYAGASSIIVPIAIIAGSLCALAIICEVGHLGYLYTTDQINNLKAEYDRITKFAGQFYNFDQAPAAHVENIAMLAITLIWPWQRETIFNSLMGMKNIHCNMYLDSDTIVQQKLTVTSKQFNDALEYIKQPELNIFNIEYKKIFNEHIFDFHPQPKVALAGISENIIEQEIISFLPSTHLLTEQTNKVTENVVNTIISQVSSDSLQNLNNEVELTITKQVEVKIIEQNVHHEVIKLQDILTKEITRETTKPVNFFVDLTIPINSVRAAELANLVPQIRQLQELAKYTNNFSSVEELISEDILYLNRIYELQTYRAQIKNFLDAHNLFFVHEGKQYFIADIASYHIHAGDYFRKDKPDGAHSNFGGYKLGYFSPELIKKGPLNTSDMILHNSRFKNRVKPSCIYSEEWSEFICDLKAIEVMTSNTAEIVLNKTGTTFIIKGSTSENLEIIIYYDIKNKRIKTHYPNII